ncbi:MAG: UDP-N-acetylmuramoyl-L-alanine--D-glutamate ligase [Bacteroidota bacterium]|nr:UDP-N-acetylmuramoyl-L-alanine--D-glutamate ligase [Bacteroidota bacterium]
MERLKEYFAGYPKIMLLGFGREGRSSYRLLRAFFPEKTIGIADWNERIPEENPELLQDQYLKLYAGIAYLRHLADYDLVLKSPGVKLEKKHSKEIKNLTSQTDIFLRFFGRQCIGVTGTKGKSTTSSLIAHILKEQAVNTFLIGNIGKPPFDFIHRITNKTRLIFELSSHQLLDVKHAPHIAVLLNLYDEHLDFYKSAEDYFRAKFNIFRYQGTDDFAVINGDDRKIPGFFKEIEGKAKIYGFSTNSRPEHACFLKGDMICFSENKETDFCFQKDINRNLIGKHNLYNIMAAFTASLLAGSDSGTIPKALSSFTGLPHRLEYAGNYGGIHFYNDSIATIPEASIAALESLPDTDSIILGGFDRGLSYDALAVYLGKSRLSNIIFMGPAGKRMKQLLEKSSLTDHKLYMAQDMQDAVSFAKANTANGKICLLSPAAASYDQFKNFEERGHTFKKEAGRV